MRERETEPGVYTGQRTLSLDLVFDLLSDRQRRYTLYYLSEISDGVARVDEIAEFIVTHETDSAAEGCDPDTAESDQVITTLQHAHLPKLEAAGTIEHDPRSETVRYWRHPSLEEWLEHAFHKELAQTS